MNTEEQGGVPFWALPEEPVYIEREHGKAEKTAGELAVDNIRTEASVKVNATLDGQPPKFESTQSIRPSRSEEAPLTRPKGIALLLKERGGEREKIGKDFEKAQTQNRPKLTGAMEALAAAQNGKFPEGIDPATRELLTSVITVKAPSGHKTINPELVNYVLLKDFSGPDASAQSKPFLSLQILKTISKHDSARNFGPINAAKYEDEYARDGLNEGEQKFLIAAAYLESMASGANDRQALQNFLNLIRSRNNYLLIQDVKKRVVASGKQITPKMREKLDSLAEKPETLNRADVEKAVAVKKYDFSRLARDLSGPDSPVKFTMYEIAEIIAMLKFNPDHLALQFPEKIEVLNAAISNCTRYEI